MAKKNHLNTTSLDNYSQPVSIEVEETSAPTIPETPVKKRAGRPKTKTEPEKTINIAIPISLLEKMNVAKVMYKDNLTLYVNKLIEKDIEANYQKYQQFAKMQEDIL